VNPDFFKVAGLAGVAIGAVVYVFREVIRKQVFPQLTKDQAYKLLNLIVILIFVVGVLGVTSHFFMNLFNKTSNEIGSMPSPTPLITNLGNNAQNVPSIATPTPVKSSQRVQIVQAPTPTPVTFQLTGRVVDEDDKPLQGAKVSVDDFPEREPVETVSNGVFILQNIPKKLNDGARIRVSMGGYTTKVKDVVIGRSSPRIKMEKIK